MKSNKEQKWLLELIQNADIDFSKVERDYGEGLEKFSKDGLD